MHKKILGTTGAARAGKGTFAEFFTKTVDCDFFAFSTLLYAEVAASFSIKETILREEKTKDSPQAELSLTNCSEALYVQMMLDNGFSAEQSLSPRVVLQHWGDYRRNKNPRYFVDPIYLKVKASKKPIIVIDGVRAELETRMIRNLGGTMIHIERESAKKVNDHKIEKPLPFMTGDIKLQNNSTIEDFQNKVIKLAIEVKSALH